MNRRQKLVQQQFLNNEKAVIDRLRYIYDQSLSDINAKIRGLEFQIGDLTEEYDWMDDDDPQKEIIRSRIQSKIYQKQYQEALQDQLDEVLKKMQTKQFLTVSGYLDGCYTDGFVGTVFDQHGQGVPLIMPIDQEAMVRAVQLDSKISQGLYTRLGEDVGVLKKRITSEVTRSIATGASYAQVAKRLSNQTRIGFNRAVRIARTEGHRIQCTAAMDAMIAAKDKGADVVKQWDATLDDVTRESHRQVDGEIRELDKPFSNHLMYAGDPAGGAAEVINCRCALLQRARWALDADELQTLKDRAAYFGLDKSEEFEDFKKKYLKAVEETTSAVARIDDCQTVEAVERLLKSRGWFNVRTIGKMVYDTNEGVRLAGVDLECAKSIYRTHEKLFARYPQLVGKLNSIETNSLHPFTYAQCSVGLGHGGIDVNTSYFKDAQKLAKSYDRDCLKGYHPKGTTWHSIVMHELGHAVDDYLSNSLMLAGMKNSWSPKYVSADLRPKVMRACKLKVADAWEEVSEYATKNHFEWFAECFAEYMDSPNPRKVATEFGKWFEELMKKVK